MVQYLRGNSDSFPMSQVESPTTVHSPGEDLPRRAVLDLREHRSRHRLKPVEHDHHDDHHEAQKGGSYTAAT